VRKWTKAARRFVVHVHLVEATQSLIAALYAAGYKR